MDNMLAVQALPPVVDRFKFRTPPLRNVELTGPWMHNGAYIRLKDAVKHHPDPEYALLSYDPGQLAPDIQETYQGSDALKQDLLKTVDPIVEKPVRLSEKEVEQIIAFLGALTAPEARDLSHVIPESVPSGLPVED